LKLPATRRTDIAELPGQLKYADLGTDYFLLLSHGGLLAVRASMRNQPLSDLV
jgi:hypothetical protein